MSDTELNLLQKFASGVIDAYTVQDVRPLLVKLLVEHAQLQQLNESLCNRIAAQSELLSKKAEKVQV